MTKGAGSARATCIAVLVICVVLIYLYCSMEEIPQLSASGEYTSTEPLIAAAFSVEEDQASHLQNTSSNNNEARHNQLTRVNTTRSRTSTSNSRSDPEYRKVGGGCSVNPAWNYEMTGKFVRECATEATGVEGNPMLAWPKHAYVLSMPAKMAEFHQRRSFLQTFGISLERWPATVGSAVYNASDYSVANITTGKTTKTVRKWYDRSRNVTATEGANDGFLTMGERGYLESMRRLFVHAKQNKEIETVMVLDEDVVFDCHFKDRLMQVLRSGRCGGPVAAGTKRGGVLLLGASIWVPGSENDNVLWGWALTNKDLSATNAQFGGSARCYNAHSKVFGSYAVIYHRSTFDTIIAWIRSSRKPFDHIFPYLSSRHVPVRVAYPYVAIQDVGHVSSVDPKRKSQSDILARARLHHWQLDRYCYPDFRPMMAELTEMQ